MAAYLRWGGDVKAIDLQGRRVIYRGQEGRVVEANDRSGVALIALNAPLGKPAPLVRLPDTDWHELDLLED